MTSEPSLFRPGDLPDIPGRARIMPLIRYVGGKRWLLPYLAHGLHGALARSGGTYVEPFFGGGAVGLHLGWPRTTAGDVSPGLIELYMAVTEDPGAVADALETLAGETPVDDLDQTIERRGRRLNGPAYYAARDRYNTGDLPRAVRAAHLLYLVARGFNGVYRVNRTGGFNVPVGDVRNPAYPTRDALEQFAAVVAHWSFRCADFTETLTGARSGDVAFVDPPYAGTFTGYAAGGFTSTDQIRLADVLARARDLGLLVVHTNADTPEIRSLYRARGFTHLPTAELRAVNRDIEGRGRVGCLLVVSDTNVIGEDPPEEAP